MSAGSRWTPSRGYCCGAAAGGGGRVSRRPTPAAGTRARAAADAHSLLVHPGAAEHEQVRLELVVDAHHGVAHASRAVLVRLGLAAVLAPVRLARPVPHEALLAEARFDDRLGALDNLLGREVPRRRLGRVEHVHHAQVRLHGPGALLHRRHDGKQRARRLLRHARAVDAQAHVHAVPAPLLAQVLQELVEAELRAVAQRARHGGPPTLSGAEFPPARRQPSARAAAVPNAAAPTGDCGGTRTRRTAEEREDRLTR